MEQTAAAPAPPATKPAHAPAMDVIAPHAPGPVAVEPEPAASTDSNPAPAETHKDIAKDKPKKSAAKKPGNGVGMAIFATMIIVLGLAAMATYAYIKTQN